MFIFFLSQKGKIREFSKKFLTKYEKSLYSHSRSQNQYFFSLCSLVLILLLAFSYFSANLRGVIMFSRLSDSGRFLFYFLFFMKSIWPSNHCVPQIGTNEFDTLMTMFRPWEAEEWEKWKEGDFMNGTIQTLCDVRRELERITARQFPVQSILSAMREAWARVTNRQNSGTPDLCLVDIDKVKIIITNL